LGNIKIFDLRKERETLDNCGRCGGGASKPRAAHMCGLLCETTIAKDFRTSPKHKQRPHEGTLKVGTST
jgi:hypothetical protein